MAEKIKTKGVADVIFLIDVTDSMDYCIDAVKKNIMLFVDELQKARLDWRARIIGFKNYDYEKADWIDASTSPFTSDRQELKSQIELKEASGGDPRHLEESVLDALHYVSQIDIAPRLPAKPDQWRPTGKTAKCVMLFTDAGCQSMGSYIGNLDMKTVRKALELSRIRLSIVAPTSDAYGNPIKCYYELAEGNHVLYIPCGTHEEFARMRLTSAELTPQERKEKRKTFEDILHDFAKTVTASATEEAGEYGEDR